MDIVNRLAHLLNQFLHNPVCWNCGLEHEGKHLTCESCYRCIRFIHHPCPCCGLSIKAEQVICVVCQSKPVNWQKIVAPLSFKTPVDYLIRSLKYNQKLEVLKILVELVNEQFLTIEDKPQLLLPVPLHQNRYLERGFNQSLEIVKLLSKRMNIPYSDQYMTRVIDTPRQTELTIKQRKKNIKNAFQVNPELAQYQSIAIVDDVVTTGSTVAELTKQCQKIGIAKVQIWALARTEFEK